MEDSTVRDWHSYYNREVTKLRKEAKVGEAVLKEKQAANIRFCQIILMREFFFWLTYVCVVEMEDVSLSFAYQLGSYCYKNCPLKSVDNGEERSKEGRDCRS